MTDAILVALITATPPTIVGIASLLVSLKNAKKINDVHVAINSGLTRQIKNAREAGYGEGRQDERKSK